MKIEELSTGSGITLYITVNDNQPLVFESKIKDTIPRKHMVLADAIMHDGKVLSFKGKGISISALASMPGDKPILFQNISVEALKTADNSYCYNITAPKEGIPYNRRQNFRCFIGNSSPLYSGSDITDSEIVIRDVSSMGFAITCESKIDFAINQLIHVRLEDYLEETDENFSFHLYGFVVRKQELEQGKVLYGCRLNNSVSGLDNYITKKERLRLRKNRGN